MGWARKILLIKSVLKIYPRSIELVNIERIKEPKLPDKVLFGLIFINLGPLNIFPNRIPPISEDIQTNKMINNITLKWISFKPKIKIKRKKNK